MPTKFTHKPKLSTGVSMVLNAGEFVFYKSLDGLLSFYKVLTVEQDFDGLSIRIKGLDNGGEVKGKDFSTTIKDKKRGNQRLFRIWIQPKDRVYIKDAKEEGVVERFLVDWRKKEDYTNMVEIISVSKRQYLYTMDEVVNKIELVPQKDDIPF